MSTVLWANYLVNGKVTSDECDKYALCKFTEKLDSICSKQGQPTLSSMLDSTDAMFNLDEIELQPGMESTDELMAAQGVWVDAKEALATLVSLLATIESEKTRFGLIANAHDEVVGELKESIDFAKQAVAKSAQFNFAIVT